MSTNEAHVAGLMARMEFLIASVSEARDEIKQTTGELQQVKLQLHETSLKLVSTQGELQQTKTELTAAKTEITALKEVVAKYRTGAATIASLAALGGGLLSACATALAILKFWVH